MPPDASNFLGEIPALLELFFSVWSAGIKGPRAELDHYILFVLVNIFIQDDMDTCTQHGRVTVVKVAS